MNYDEKKYVPKAIEYNCSNNNNQNGKLFIPTDNLNYFGSTNLKINTNNNKNISVNLPFNQYGWDITVINE